MSGAQTVGHPCPALETVRANTGGVHALGPVNGMGEPDVRGSYIRILTTNGHGGARRYLHITPEQADALMVQLDDLIAWFRRIDPCPACGKPADTVTCQMGGCPLGGDL